MKLHMVLLILSILNFSCSDIDETRGFLKETHEIVYNEYQELNQRVAGAIKEYPEGNQGVLKELIFLDSLYKETSLQIENRNDIKHVLEKFKNDIQNGIAKGKDLESYSISIFLKNLEKESAHLQATQIANYALNEIAKKVGADYLNFDKLKIFVEADKLQLERNEGFEAKIYFGAYSSNSINHFDIYANDEELEIKDGIAYYSKRSSIPGENSVTLKVISKKGIDFSEGSETEKIINYIVK